MEKLTLTRKVSAGHTRGVFSLQSSGSSTSAASVKRRVGVAEGNTMVVVENGRRITVAELCRSVTAAAKRFLQERGVVEEGFSR